MSTMSRISTLRQYLEALGARLELAAVFDDEIVACPSSSAKSRRPNPVSTWAGHAPPLSPAYMTPRIFSRTMMTRTAMIT